jgi:hypothetical protein
MLGLPKKLGRGVRSVLRRRWVRRLTGSLIVIGLLVATGIGVSHYINAPSTGTITSVIPTVAPKPAHTVSLQGTYANFSYPSDFNPVPDDKPVPPQLEVFSFVAHKAESLLLSIQVESLPTGNLRDNGSYNFRKTYPNRYTEVVKPINGQDIHIMSDTTSAMYIKTAFFTHSGKVATVTISGGVPNDSAKTDQTLADIVRSWEWHT